MYFCKFHFANYLDDLEKLAQLDILAQLDKLDKLAH